MARMRPTPAGYSCLVGMVSFAVIGGCAAGGTSSDKAAQQRAVSDTQQIVVTREGGEFRPTCSPRQVARRLRGLSEALQVVDRAALERYWGSNFAWFRILSRRGAWFEAESSADGIRELEDRGGIVLRFREIEVGRSGGVRARAALRVRAGQSRRLGGKIELSCNTRTVIATSLFFSRRDLVDCPRPRRPVRPGALIACSRK